MTTTAKKKRLIDFIESAEDKKIKAIYSLLETEMTKEEVESDHWSDKDFVAEMDRRYEEYTSGKVKFLTLEEVEEKARKALRDLKAKKAS